VWVRDGALRLLAANPQLTTRELATTLGTKGKRGDAAFAAARRMLTIRGRARGVLARVLDMDVYRAWCAYLQIEPAATPTPAPTPAPRPAQMPAPVAEASALDASVGAACSLLLAAMRAANVTQITVAASGDVAWTRLVVTTGTAQVSE
jgi:hypothetical protein